VTATDEFDGVHPGTEAAGERETTRTMAPPRKVVAFRPPPIAGIDRGNGRGAPRPLFGARIQAPIVTPEPPVRDEQPGQRPPRRRGTGALTDARADGSDGPIPGAARATSVHPAASESPSWAPGRDGATSGARDLPPPAADTLAAPVIGPVHGSDAAARDESATWAPPVGPPMALPDDAGLALVTTPEPAGTIRDRMRARASSVIAARTGGLPTGAPRSAAPALAGLDARGISAWFGSHQVLDRVSLAMPPGAVTALIGPSGCGKSTFLRILNRMHELIPSARMAGEVLLDGSDVYDPARRITAARRQIGMVFQKPNPFPAMSIYDNVLAGLKLTGSKADQAMKDSLVEESLVKAGLWKEVRDRLRQPGGALSGGQQQRLCIARSLAIRPRVLLMDEPCSALDPTSTRRIEDTIEELKTEVTIVIVTHNMQQAMRVSTKCAFFLAELGTPGYIVEHGDTEAMFSSPQDSRTLDYVSGRFG
jgi:phosphate transport system ATP-binding protein